MRLIRIDGEIWKMSCLQKAYSKNGRNVALDVANEKIIRGEDISDVTRILSGNAVRSEASAIIEIIVCGLPQQKNYDIYHGTKGFFCKVQGSRVYLRDLVDEYGKG